MRAFVSLVLAVLCLLGLVLAGEMVAQVAIARAEGRPAVGLDLQGQLAIAMGLILVAGLWVTTAWRQHSDGKRRAVENARSERLRRLNDRLRLTNESLRESDKIKDDLLATTSHELRTPLTAILGFSEMLLDVPDSEARALAMRIQRGGQRLRNTVNGLLDMFKLQSGTLELVPEHIDVASQVRSIVGMLRPLAEERGLDLRVHPADLALPAHLDRDALERIVTNLVANALKFTTEGGVAVTVDATPEIVTVAVTDSGIGIAAEDVPSLFLPFTQASMGSERTHEGTGLGLAIVRQLVDLMGGEIHVESRVGVGTRIRVEFPRWASLPVSGGAPIHAPPSPALAGGKVFTLELPLDEVRVLLGHVGATGEVFAADTLPAGVEELQQSAYDAVFVGASDARTERKRTRRIRRIPGYSRTPLIRVGGGALDAATLQRHGFTHQISVPLREARFHHPRD
ncbi:MAG: HAMP domain-containing sensor histidine kinase [Bacteroidota bacterium]